MITDEQIHNALYLLAVTAEEYASAVAEYKSLELILKSVEASEFLEAEGKSVEAKKAVARSSDKTLETIEKYKDAAYRAELLRAKREHAKILISYAQSKMRADLEGRM